MGSVPRAPMRSGELAGAFVGRGKHYTGFPREALIKADRTTKDTEKKPFSVRFPRYLR
jgi:hypothetical protein